MRTRAHCVAPVFPSRCGGALTSLASVLARSLFPPLLGGAGGARSPSCVCRRGGAKTGQKPPRFACPLATLVVPRPLRRIFASLLYARLQASLSDSSGYDFCSGPPVTGPGNARWIGLARYVTTTTRMSLRSHRWLTPVPYHTQLSEKSSAVLPKFSSPQTPHLPWLIRLHG